MTLRLTETEARVMRLAAAGFRAEEIAEALDLSHGTVTWHLTQSYRKLGLGSRAEVTARIAECHTARETTVPDAGPPASP
jgi:DNA-binding CsgD family transcriptional regulator